MKWELFCTVTMNRYVVEASSELEAKRKLAIQLSVPVNCIIAFG